MQMKVKKNHKQNQHKSPVVVTRAAGPATARVAHMCPVVREVQGWRHLPRASGLLEVFLRAQLYLW